MKAPVVGQMAIVTDGSYDGVVGTIVKVNSNTSVRIQLSNGLEVDTSSFKIIPSPLSGIELGRG